MANSNVPTHLCFDGVLQYTKLYFAAGLDILGKVAENAEQSAAVVITWTLQLLLLLFIIIDPFYIALFTAFKQTHCARM